MPTRDLASLSKSVWDALYRIESATEREILANYRVALEDIRKDLGRAYEKWAKAGSLTKAEMTKYNRQLVLEKQLTDALGPQLSKNGKLVGRLAEAEYHESFFRHAWAIEQNAGVALKWGLLPTEAIKAAVQNELAALAEKGVAQDALLGIRRVLTQGLIRGVPYEEMAKGMKSLLERSAAGYLRIAQTEAHRAIVLGQIDNYADAEDLGIKLKRVWVATLDDRTRDTHGEMDGVEADENGLFDTAWGVVNGPGLDGPPEETINCRCRIVAEIEDMEPKVRRVRDEGVVPYLTYKEWAKEHGITPKG